MPLVTGETIDLTLS